MRLEGPNKARGVLLLKQLDADDDPEFDIVRIFLARNDCQTDISSREDIKKVADAIAKSSCLNCLEIIGLPTRSQEIHGIIDRATEELAMLGSGLKSNTSIKLIRFGEFSHLEDNAIQQVTSFLESSPTLEKIHLSTAMLRSHLRIIGTALSKREKPMGMVFFPLQSSEGDFESFLRPFRDAPSKIPKSLRSPNNVGLSGCQEIAQLLQLRECSVKEIIFGRVNNQIGDAGITTLAKAVKWNKKLILLDIPKRGNVTSVGWNALQLALCNPDSITRTYESNHTLNNVGLIGLNNSPQFPVELRRYLNFNTFDNKSMIARVKILIHHFDNRFHMGRLEGLDPSLLVKVVAYLDVWITEFENHSEPWAGTGFPWDGMIDHAAVLGARRTIIHHLVTTDPLFFEKG